MLPDLPVRPALPRIVDAMERGGAAVLVAPPGSGKTTLVPLALAERIPGRIVVAEPRRVAARAAAARMASLLGGPVGERVGYTVRGERKAGKHTRIEVVTTGVLVRRLQRDPELPGVGAVILDECHERALESDLALAFTVDVRGNLRDDLAVLATSATAASERLADALGGAPVLRVPGSPHPVATVWCPPPAPVTPPHGSRVDPRLLDHVSTVIRRAAAETPGDVLVFLPGVREIDAVARRLSGLEEDVVQLHGRLPARAQDAVLEPAPGVGAAAARRVVLATAVAESSLTVPGVRAVVDAGLARVPRLDQARGLGSLVTVPVSRASAVQRAGRAGREGPGTAYRCWSEADDARLPAWPEPAIASADLTGFALELACWGEPTGAGLALPDQPPPAALEIARETLRALGAVDAGGRVTARGRTLAGLAVPPRLARALLDGAGEIGSERAGEVVALLADDTLAGNKGDLTAAWRGLRNGNEATQRWRAEARRLAAGLPRTAAGSDGRLPDDLAAGLLVGMAYPERLARARKGGATSYLMAGGTAAELPAGSPLEGVEWLAVAVADRSPGQASARIRLAAALDVTTARKAGAALLAGAEEVGWADGDVVAVRAERLGAITLTERPLATPAPQAVRGALLDGVEKEGLGLLRWSTDARVLRERLAFLHAALGGHYPAMDDQSLLAQAEAWLGPDLAGARRRADLAKVDAGTALRRLLPWPVAARLDELAPERLLVPSGSRVRIDYSDPEAPVLAVKVQEAFGWTRAPRLAGGKVPVRLHLLSPAGRPVAVTTDLASFWRNGYPQVRAELRGRYPRHPWPEDPTVATPTKRTNPRR